MYVRIHARLGGGGGVFLHSRTQWTFELFAFPFRQDWRFGIAEVGKHIETTQRLIIIRPSAFFFFSALTKSRTEIRFDEISLCVGVPERKSRKLVRKIICTYMSHWSHRVHFFSLFTFAIARRESWRHCLFPWYFRILLFFYFFRISLSLVPNYICKRKKKKNGHTRYLSRFPFLPGSTGN